MEESDSGQQPKRCSCGFWGSPQTSGLCSKCYKAVVQEKTQDTLDAKAELMRERQSAYGGHDSLGGASSSYLATSCSQSSASDVEKAGELIRQAVRNSSNANNNSSNTNSSSQSVEFTTNNSSSKSVATNTDTSTDTTSSSNNTATSGSGNSADDSECSLSSSSSTETKNTEKTVSVSSSTSTSDSAVGVTVATSGDSTPLDNSVDNNSVASSKDSSPSSDAATAAATSAVASTASTSESISTSCPTTPDKRGVKRDSSVLDEGGTGTPDSTPEKPGARSKKRCNVCKCKLELAQRTIGRCRCDNVYCSLHRLPELHHCDFDHKEDGRREAREKMVKPTRHLGTSFKRLGSDS